MGSDHWTRYKSFGSQEVRALLVAPEQLLGKLTDVELSMRSILRGFDLKMSVVTRKGFEARSAQVRRCSIAAAYRRRIRRRTQVKTRP